MAAGPLETEIKIRLSPADRFPQMLVEVGFHESAPRIFEANTLFDTADHRLRSGGTLLRVREIPSAAILTWKGVAHPGPHKSRPELETTVGSAAAFAQILASLGFVPTFRYEKYRTEYRRDDSGVVTFDETPIGRFLELEGAPDWIDATARELGFPPDRYLLESYGKLYLLACEERGVAPTHMIFADGSNGSDRAEK